jgi:signal transduction histidine kinase
LTPARKNLAAAVADLLEIGIWLVDARGKTIYRNSPMAALAPGVESLDDLAAYMPEVPIRDYLDQLKAGDPAIIETRVRRIGAEGRTARLRFTQVPAFQPARPSMARAGSFTLIMMEEILEKPASDPVIEAVRTAAICHEVNNPLAILSGQVELLAREQSALTSRVTTMQGAVGRIAEVVRRLHRAAEVLRHAPRPVKAKTKEKAA